MEGFNTILHSIVMLALMMGVGFAGVKTKYISVDVKNALSKIIVRITLPMLVIMSLTKVELDAAKIKNSLILVSVGFTAILILYLSGILTSRLFKMEKKTAVVHQCMSAFGNVVFLGYPLIESIFGAEGIFYAALYGFANDLLMWTLGIYKIASLKGDGNNARENLKNLLNPATIAFCISLVMMAFGWKFTGVVGEVLSGMGGTTTYLSMIFIGGTLASVDFRHIYKRVSIFVLTIVKMVIAPILMMFAARLLPIDNMVKAVLILQLAMPTQTMIAILSTEYDGDINYVAEGIFITTLVSLISIPFVYYMMGVIGIG